MSVDEGVGIMDLYSSCIHVYFLGMFDLVESSPVPMFPC